MKKAFISFFSFIGTLLSYIFPLVLFKVITKLSNAIRSGYIKQKFKACGNNFSIDYPFYHEGLKYIAVGDNFVSFSGLRLEAYSKHIGYQFTPELIIGNNVSFNNDCHIGCINKIQIGNNVLIASKVFITDHFHGTTDPESIVLPPSKRKAVSRGPVIIEDNVWIGEGVAVMPGITIGANSIVGANAVVTKSFAPNSVIGGNPAKLIKTIK